jgi:predicted unusual protein kinase regulating ubiquinone biosynthesis (AarF/ABC1/UbiB family)
VKIGQIASCREDLLPREWVTELERLQDQVPARHGRDALELAYVAWPGGHVDFHRTFSEFESTPLAAASLGQVHKGRLQAKGELVAIKLQRPHLKEIYEQDMALLSKIAACVDQMANSCGVGRGGVVGIGGVSQSWIEIFRDAQAILEREIDYRDEARHMARFCADFGLAKGGIRGAPVGRHGPLQGWRTIAQRGIVDLDPDRARALVVRKGPGDGVRA